MVDKVNIKEEYQKFSKYNLPDYDKLNEEFEFYTLEKTDFLLQNMRRRIHNKLAYFAQIIEGIIYPNPSSLVNMQEAKFFNEEEKTKITQLYKKIVLFERNSSALDISSDEKENATYIQMMYKEWPAIKEQMKAILKKMQDSWKK